MDDTQIFFALKARDKQAFDALYDMLYPQVRFFTEQITKDHGEAEDIAIHALAKFWEKGPDDFETILQVRKYIFTIARNAAFDFLKKIKVRKIHQRDIIYMTPATEESLVESTLYKVEMLQVLMAEIENLPEQCRETFKLVYIEKMPRLKVAEILNITAGTVNVHCANAMKKLRKIFSERELAVLLVAVGVCVN